MNKIENIYRSNLLKHPSLGRLLKFKGKPLSILFLSILLTIPYLPGCGTMNSLKIFALRDNSLCVSDLKESLSDINNIGRRYALVFYGELSTYMANSILDKGYKVEIAILEPSNTPSPPKIFKDSGIISLGYLDILGVPSSLLNWVKETHPEWLLYTGSGEPARYWYGQNLICNLAIDSFKEYLIDRAKSIAEKGYDGVFLDDVVINPSLLGGPLYDQPIYDEPKYGSWITHLVELFRRIRNETGMIVVYNAGWSLPNEQLMEAADGVMLESHPGSWSGNVNSPSYYLRDWNAIYNVSIVAQKYAERGKMIIALNYGGDERVEFYTYAAVRLFDFYYWYSTPALNSISDSKVLKLDLGEPLGEHQEVNGTYFRTYSNGIVVLNPTNKISRVSIKVPQHLSRLIDIKTMRICEAHNGDLTLEIGPQEGFVLLCEDAIKKENLNPLFLSGWIIIMITITTVIIVFFKKRRCFPQGSRNQKPKTIPSILI
jgi:endo-alpha-1,4-polygalactosaminidase (GH114 family)